MSLEIIVCSKFKIWVQYHLRDHPKLICYKIYGLSEILQSTARKLFNKINSEYNIESVEWIIRPVFAWLEVRVENGQNSIPYKRCNRSEKQMKWASVSFTLCNTKVLDYLSFLLLLSPISCEMHCNIMNDYDYIQCLYACMHWGSRCKSKCAQCVNK